jgi:hypothetical protein
MSPLQQEIDRQAVTCRFLNADLVEWSTHYSKPYGV